MAKNDGGPAFPHIRERAGEKTYREITSGGLSQRRFIAALALQGILSSGQVPPNEPMQAVVKVAFDWADELIEFDS